MRDRLCAILLMVALEGACASAPRTRSFQDLPKYLDHGNTIKLTETTGPTTTGRLETLSPASLTILTAGSLRDVPQSRVTKIQRPERWIGRGALIGLGVGVGLGLITYRQGEPSGSPIVDTQAFGVSVAGGMVFGAAVGAIMGAVVKVNRTVYMAPIPSDPQSRSRPSTDRHQRPALVLAGSDGRLELADAAQPAAAPDGRRFNERGRR